jgi:hypothetical protein
VTTRPPWGPRGTRDEHRSTQRVENDAQTDLPPPGAGVTRQSSLTRSTMDTPRPAVSNISGARRAGAQSEPSCTLRNTARSACRKLTVNGDCACLTAFPASSLTTSRTSSTRYNRRCSTRWTQTKRRALKHAHGFTRHRCLVPPRTWLTHGVPALRQYPRTPGGWVWTAPGVSNPAPTHLAGSGNREKQEDVPARRSASGPRVVARRHPILDLGTGQPQGAHESRDRSCVQQGDRLHLLVLTAA